MRILKTLILLGILAILAFGCKKKSDENQPVTVPPPVSTAPKIDTTAMLDVDTMPAVEQLPDLPSAPSGSGYVVQVASATDGKYARYLVDLWKGRGYEPFVTTITHNNETYYRIRLGLYESHARAKNVVAELADKYSLKTWIDQI
jgi:cell division septation protein DedD